MAPPDKNAAPAPQTKAITAPAGTNFQLRWTMPHNVRTTISFVNSDGASQDFPDLKCTPQNGYPGTDKPMGTATITVTVKKGADAASMVADDFRDNRTAPTLKVTWPNQSGINYFNAGFLARDVGLYEFTSVIVKSPAGQPSTTQTLIETVTCTPGDAISPKRQAMLDLFDAWLPTSLLGKSYPKKYGDPSQQQDLFDMTGWVTNTPSWSFDEITYDGQTKHHSGTGLGQQGAEQHAANDARDAAYNAALAKYKADPSSGSEPAAAKHQFTAIVTSCGSILGKFLSLWGCDFDGDGSKTTREMSIADDYQNDKTSPVQYGGKHYGYWVDAADAFKKPSSAGDDWQPQYPKAGDVVVLWDDTRNIRAHVCLVVSASEDTWTTAEGGGGALPDQTASKNNKDVAWQKVDKDHPKGIPYILDVTTGKSERVTGWIDLDKVPNWKLDQKP